MRIVMHCLYFPPEVGGLESHVHQLCRGLARRGHDVGVVTSRSRADAPVTEELDGVRVARTWLPSRGPLGWGAHAVLSAPVLARVARGADVLHAQAFQSVPAGVWARRRCGAPLVATFHTSHFLTRAERRAWRPFLRWAVRAGDHSLAASREIADVAERLAPDTTVEALTNGVDTETFRRVEPTLGPGRPIRLLVPRRLFAKNGVEYFLRAMPYISSRIDAEAVLVGDGPERERLERLTGELGVAERVRFLGARPHADMPGLLSSGTLAVFPSLMEATSVAALESMACELPVAASRVGGLPEIVDDDVGTLFEPADPGSLADAVVALVETRDLRALGRAARERVVDRWSNERLVDRHLEIYEGLLGGR